MAYEYTYYMYGQRRLPSVSTITFLVAEAALHRPEIISPAQTRPVDPNRGATA